MGDAKMPINIHRMDHQLSISFLGHMYAFGTGRRYFLPRDTLKMRLASTTRGTFPQWDPQSPTMCGGIIHVGLHNSEFMEGFGELLSHPVLWNRYITVMALNSGVQTLGESVNTEPGTQVYSFSQETQQLISIHDHFPLSSRDPFHIESLHHAK